MRACSHQPVLAILDEATSALSPEEEAVAYRLLREHEVNYVSIAHRPSVMQFHQKVCPPLKSVLLRTLHLAAAVLERELR